MASFDEHSTCARCRDKGVGDDLYVQKKDCHVAETTTFNPHV